MTTEEKTLTEDFKFLQQLALETKHIRTFLQNSHISHSSHSIPIPYPSFWKDMYDETLLVEDIVK